MSSFFSVYTFHDQSPKIAFLVRIWTKVYEEVEVKIVSGVVKCAAFEIIVWSTAETARF